MGGGKIIKDATATPEKVFEGEIFYSNAGRQVGTFSMADATATPADVASGKTFYTGAGKQTGVFVEALPGMKHVKFYSNVTASGSHNTSSNMDVFARTYTSISMSSHSDSSYGGLYGLKAYQVSGQILFALINGKLLPAGAFYSGANAIIIKNYDSFCASIENNRATEQTTFYYKHNYSALPNTIEIDLFFK